MSKKYNIENNLFQEILKTKPTSKIPLYKYNENKKLNQEFYLDNLLIVEKGYSNGVVFYENIYDINNNLIEAYFILGKNKNLIFKNGNFIKEKKNNSDIFIDIDNKNKKGFEIKMNQKDITDIIIKKFFIKIEEMEELLKNKKLINYPEKIEYFSDEIDNIILKYQTSLTNEEVINKFLNMKFDFILEDLFKEFEKDIFNLKENIYPFIYSEKEIQMNKEFEKRMKTIIPNSIIPNYLKR